MAAEAEEEVYQNEYQQQQNEQQQQQQQQQRKRPWWKIRWFSEDLSKEERKLVMKLDLLIVPYAFLSYWVKYIDQANMSELNIISMQIYHI